MTLDLLFVLVVPTYLVLVAYGQVGSRKRGLRVDHRAIAGALRVTVPPLAIAGALWATRDPHIVAAWIGVTLAMLVAGIVVAVLVEIVAPRIGA